MIAPDLFGYSKTAADNDHIVGPVIAMFAIIALWEATRNLRWALIPLGGWLLLAPWILGYDSSLAIVNDMLVGALVIGALLVLPLLGLDVGYGLEARDVQIYLAIGLTD